MNEKMEKTLGVLLVAGALALPGAASAGNFGKVDAVANTDGALVDSAAGVKSPGDLYVQGFCRTRAMHTWDEGGDNVFVLCAGDVGYKGLTLGLQERFSAGSDYQMAPFASIRYSGAVDLGEEISLSGGASFTTSLPADLLELRVAADIDIDNKDWYVPSTVELESFTWLAEGDFSGTERLFVGYDIGALEVGPYIELDWTQEGASVAPGIKLRYDGD